jgi:elongator complex protein 3
MMFEDQHFRPDMLKIYPTLVVKGTPLYEKWSSGEYQPYSTQQAVEVIAKMKALAPKYVRIQRIQRDIPVDLIEAGVCKGHLRELVRAQMRVEGTRCKCIRCREVGLNRVTVVSPDQVTLNQFEYEASNGLEVFISHDVEQRNGLVGYARLRLASQGDVAHLRELKVFGLMAQLGTRGKEWQHRGFGKELMAEAEGIAVEAGYKTMKVTSGIGARRYYSSLGYEREDVYMTKVL